MRRPHTHSPHTLQAVELLGTLISQHRRNRGWRLEDLAERAGVSVGTLRSIERGNPSVRIGSAFEAAALVGINLFDSTTADLSVALERARDELHLLPTRVRTEHAADDDDF